MIGSSDSCLVVDVGGTSTRAALYQPETNSLLNENRKPTPSHWSSPDLTVEAIQCRLFEELSSMAKSILVGNEPSTVSIAFPGPVDSYGNVFTAPTVWGDLDKQPFPLLKRLQCLWPLSRVLVMNDVTAAGYRYLRDEHEDFCIVTVSSGIGQKVFISGKPILGTRGRGGEIGHVRVDFSSNAPVCECGEQGHLSAVTSGRGVFLSALRLAKQDPEKFSRSLLGQLLEGNISALSNEAIAKAFKMNDSWTYDLIRNAARPLGQVLAALHTAIGIERFVIIGGFALSLGENYRQELVNSAKESCWCLGQDWEFMIALGENDDRSGLIGAGRCAMLFANRSI